MRRLAVVAVTLASLLSAGGAMAQDHYVNSFADPRWEAGRIDMGMDWAPMGDPPGKGPNRPTGKRC